MRKIVKDSAKLLLANAIAQGIGIVVYFLLTRLYSPDDFGLLNLFTSIGSVLILVSTAEYQYAIVLPKEEDKARAIVHVCVLLLCGVTALVLLSLPFAKPIACLFKAPSLSRWWWLLPGYVLLAGLWNILNYVYIRSSLFSRISGYQISQSLLNACSKVGLGYAGFLSGGLIVSSVIAPLLAVLTSVGLGWRKCLRSYAVRCPKGAYKRAAGEYANFPRYNLPRSLVNAVGLAIPTWLLTRYFGLEEVGRLSLALMAAFVPLNIIARACYQVLYQRVAVLVQAHAPIRSVMLRFVVLTLCALSVGLPLVYWLVPDLVTLLFGAEWIGVSAIIRALYPALVLVPVCGSICFLSDVFGKQQTAMWMEIGYVIAVCVALGLGIQSESFLTAISAYAWVGFGYLSVQLLWFLSLIYRYQRTL